jgi:hypothetical protein
VNRNLQRIWDDPERLKWWTLEQLYGVDIRDLTLEDRIDIMEEHSPHRQDKTDRAGGMGELRRGLLRIKQEDPEMFVQMMTDTPSYWRYVRKRPRGRPPGSAVGIAEAWAERARIRDIWRGTFGKSNRKDPPTAVDIAAWRHDFDPGELINYGKNRNKLKGR